MFKRNLAACCALFALVSAGPVAAAPTWYSNLTLDTAGYYWDGANDVWAVSWVESVTTGCAVTDTQKKAAWFASGSNTTSMTIGNLRLAPALLALGSNLKVDLMIDPAACNATYGAGLQGVRVHR